VPKTFELPEPLLHRAEAAAADEGCPLEHWVALSIEAKVTAHEETARALAASEAALKAFASRLQRLPDGSLFNPDGIDDEGFFATLENLRSGRLP
jgi:hypothetical protein